MAGEHLYTLLPTPYNSNLGISQMSNNYDVIVIGAGHNGLIAAHGLAKAGKSVLVVEQRGEDEALFPGFRLALGMDDDAGLLRQSVIDGMGLVAHGVAFVEPEVTAFAPQLNGRSLTLHRHLQHSIANIATHSEQDAGCFAEWREKIGQLTAVLEPHLHQPPTLEQMGALLLGQSELVRYANVSARETLNWWFENEPLKGLLASSSVIGLEHGPYAQNSGFMLLYQYANADGGGFRASRFVQGGMGKLRQAMVAAAVGQGVEIWGETAVSHILLHDGRATGVQLTDGQTIHAGLVVSSATPRHTFFHLVKPYNLEPRFMRRVRSRVYRGTTAKLVLAVSHLPEFLGQTDAAQLDGHIVLCPSTEYLEQAADAAKYGRFSPRPLLDLTIPTRHAPELAPAGQHLLNITMRYAPYTLRGSSWGEQREALAETILQTLESYAPGLRDTILHQHLITPLDWEQQFGLTEGCLHHGQMGLEQMFAMRPIPGWSQYTTPITNLYLCGAGTHPGGGLTGLPGSNAARLLTSNQ